MTEYKANFKYKPDLSTAPDEEDRNTCPDCGAYAGTKHEYCIDCR